MADDKKIEVEEIVVNEIVEATPSPVASAADTEHSEDQEIDLIAIAKTLWHEKKLIIIWCVVGMVLGLVVAFSIPREYTTDITLAPELGDAKSNTNISALAAMAGISSSTGSSDAVYPTLYPDIISSVPFQLSLLDIPVQTDPAEKPIKLQTYLLEDVKTPWWSVITGLPRQLIALLKGSDDEEGPAVSGPGLIELSKEEELCLVALTDRVTCSVDNKTMVVTLSAKMQDALVSAIVADTVCHRLQEYVTTYRTNKSRGDMMYMEKLTEEAKQKYYAAQQRYAQYLDTHQGIVMYSSQIMRDRLENEAMLAFNVYNQMAQKLELAKAKVQEETPVFAVIEPAVVPLKPSAPRKVLILAGFIFLAFVGACAWILFGRPLRAEFSR